MIEFDHVSAAYTTFAPVFENWSFTISSNTVTTILGANGSGKTTLLKCLTNQLRLCQGDVRIDGVRVASLHARELANLISYVPQSYNTSIDFRVLDFIALGRTPHLKLLEMPSEADYRIARHCAEKSEITHLLEKSMTMVSGGERQLAYIARALAQETPIIIMDEPMSALDFENQAMILEKISSFAANGKTIIFTSHNPNHALAISSDVLLIDQAGNLLQGSADRLLRDNSILAKVFGGRVSYRNTQGGGYVTFNIG